MNHTIFPKAVLSPFGQPVTKLGFRLQLPHASLIWAQHSSHCSMWCRRESFLGPRRSLSLIYHLLPVWTQNTLLTVSMPLFPHLLKRRYNIYLQLGLNEIISLNTGCLTTVSPFPCSSSHTLLHSEDARRQKRRAFCTEIQMNMYKNSFV